VTICGNPTDCWHLEESSGILEAEKQLVDKIWYVRRLILREKIGAGEHEAQGLHQGRRCDRAMSRPHHRDNGRGHPLGTLNPRVTPARPTDKLRGYLRYRIHRSGDVDPAG
jgi:hypothetical protein